MDLNLLIPRNKKLDKNFQEFKKLGQLLKIQSAREKQKDLSQWAKIILNHKPQTN
ncbi:MAG: hypothetical protein ACKVOD_04955 [Flavobacterium sp.]